MVKPQILCKIVWLIWHENKNWPSIFHWEQLFVNGEAAFECVAVETVKGKGFKNLLDVHKFIHCQSLSLSVFVVKFQKTFDFHQTVACHETFLDHDFCPTKTQPDAFCLILP